MRFGGPAKIVLWGVAAVLAVAALFFVTNRAQDDEPIVLRSYEVPRELVSELHRALGSALWRGQDVAPLGQVTLLPNGHLLVTAPASVQAGVHRIIGEIRESKPGPTPTIRFDAWIVAATPGAAMQEPDALAEIEPALAVIRKAKGSMNFRLLEKLSTLTRSGHDESEVKGALSQMKIQASLRKAAGDQQVVAARVEIGFGSAWGNPANSVSLDAEAELPPGELLVVGQSAMAAPVNGPKPDAQVYYILRATL